MTGLPRPHFLATIRFAGAVSLGTHPPDAVDWVVEARRSWRSERDGDIMSGWEPTAVVLAQYR